MNELEQAEYFKERITYFFKGNQDAINLCLDLVFIMHIWDDLIDKDKPLADDKINDAFRAALVTIPLNRFYQTYQFHLIPLIQNCILQWEDANKMEKSKEDGDLNQAWMLRAAIYQLIDYIALIIGGTEWARQVGVEIRKMYSETLEEFKEEMTCQGQQ